MIKRFLGKATGHNDHYRINMGGQRPKIGSNTCNMTSTYKITKYRAYLLRQFIGPTLD